MKFKFKKPHEDLEIQEIQRSLEDDLSDKDSEIEKRDIKITEISKSVPQNMNLKKGDKSFYFDGTNYYRYYKIGAKLFRTQLTEV